MQDIWNDLTARAKDAKQRPIISLFDTNPSRFESFSAQHDGLMLDFSKTNLDSDTMQALHALANAAGVPAQREAMFSGAAINVTEGRSVLHTALRPDPSRPVMVDGQDVTVGVRASLDQMAAFAEGLRDGTITASDGQPFTDVVNIGIGGSDLGPAMACRALSPFIDQITPHFVSNIDGAHIADTLAHLDPQRTLVIIASKTFTTIETLTNADTAVGWLKDAVGDRFGAHLAAVSTAEDKTSAYGISSDRVFGFEDWVGGRYSMWGPVGLSIMIAIGPEHFSDFLAGALSMDTNFLTAEPDQNLPLILALVGLWHNNFCGYESRAVLPYDQRLGLLPAYLQQLDMESNGKHTTKDGKPVSGMTGPIVWGEPGTNGQHAFYQLLHQGTRIVPAEFLIAAESHEPGLKHQHDILKANCLAQSEALMVGTQQDDPQPSPERRFDGNRPSITIAYQRLTPFVLGQLVSLYEHRVFVEGAVWGINSFDQFGVELGKKMAKDVQNDPDALARMSGSTRGLSAFLS
ncbi:MAG: glucose-6-phosphate isomerase [Alphaproteobacteria bacterium]